MIWIYRILLLQHNLLTVHRFDTFGSIFLPMIRASSRLIVMRWSCRNFALSVLVYQLDAHEFLLGNLPFLLLRRSHIILTNFLRFKTLVFELFHIVALVVKSVVLLVSHVLLIERWLWNDLSIVQRTNIDLLKDSLLNIFILGEFTHSFTVDLWVLKRSYVWLRHFR